MPRGSTKEIEAKRDLVSSQEKFQSHRERARGGLELPIASPSRFSSGKMSPLVILLGALVFLSHCCASGASDKHREMAGEHVSGAMSAMNKPLTPLPRHEGRQFLEDYPNPSFVHRYRPQKCPLCDSSVYPYCGEKMFHDACCCEPHLDDLPYQCRLADCRFLHANSCREHRLIANCCCSDDYRAFLKILENA